MLGLGVVNKSAVVMLSLCVNSFSSCAASFSLRNRLCLISAMVVTAVSVQQGLNHNDCNLIKSKLERTCKKA